ncbi:AAA family ATPase [Enterocloster bolteae]|mgnify:FL=1|uniref:AAA family ATPase n=1 Tax=Enterocloster bolteae TaxID=208479 RepID=UPI002A837102|nr:AAA family ATPase [Enterocloster bolteae]
MNRPDSISVYDELDLKLGIKSSLPHVKSTIALAILLWECADRPAELVYSQQNGDGIVMTDDLDQWVIDCLSEICQEDEIDSESLISVINENQLFKSQMEALIVAFELVWKLAKVSFVDEGKAASAERTGGNRYPKKLLYTVNADIIHSLIESNHDAYIRVLMAWVGFNINTDPECESHLMYLLTALSEGAVFKLMDGNRDVIFNQNSLYRKVLETQEAVDVNGDKEAKGSLRILKSLLTDGMNPYLSYSNGSVSIMERRTGDLEAYQKRVDTFLRLSATKVIGLEDMDAEDEGIAPEQYEEHRLTTGCNVLLYGVPGSGKSWTIEHEYCKKESRVERLVFHPDYTYSDFIGQILPNVAEDGQVSYKFTAGPFTNILHDAYTHPEEEYILIIEEINRGNAPAIFGEVFQLLDRKVDISETDDDGFPIGTSEYGITNANIARIVYGDPRQKVRIPSNLSIIGTMNTSDQNVFTLDTAFQRRWDMRLIENNFNNVDPELANAEILDTTVTWKDFCTAINGIVIGNSARMTSSEDKRLGAYFVHLRDLKKDDRMGNLSDGEYDGLRKKESAGTLTGSEKARLAEIREAMKQYRKFPEKVIKYLWDDAFKFNREVVFESTEYQSLEQVIRAFMYAQGIDRFKMFKENVVSDFRDSEQ